MSSINKSWAENEVKAVQMALNKMQSIGLVDSMGNELPKAGFIKEDIPKMFEQYLDHFRRVCHDYSDKPRLINEYL